MRNSIITTWIFLLLLYPFQSFAEDGFSDQKIVFGQSAALTGPVSALGLGMRDGILAAFKEVNDSGGIARRQLTLVSYDDAYEPDHAIAHAQKLINDDRVFALIGGVGTPTSNAVLPLISNAQVPFIGPFTGASFLRFPFNRYTVNVRASYAQETEEWVERLTKDLGIRRIAVFYQDDSYGLSGLAGVMHALDKRGMHLVGEGSYKRNTVAIKEAAINISDSDPEAVIMIGAYKPCAAFIKLAKQLGIRAYFLNISFVGSEALAKELGSDANGVLVSQVLPSPYNPATPIAAAYQYAMQNYNGMTTYSFVSFEGYVTGRLTIEVLRHIPGDITREGFLNTLYNLQDIEINGLHLRYGESDNQGLDKIFLTALDKNGHFSEISHLSREDGKHE